METILTQKLARQRLLQSQMRALDEELIAMAEEVETLADEIEQLEEELQKQEDVQTDARFDELIDNMMGNPLEEIDELIPQRQPKAWSHADEETDNDR